LRLIGAVTEGSGTVNEDGLGHIGPDGDVSAAWIFDGVTGINGRNYLPGGSDAQWFVAKAGAHLRELAARDMPLDGLLEELVAGLIGDWAEISPGLDLPDIYDPPAACLILVKRYGTQWQALRLGDSGLLSRDPGGEHRIHTASPNNVFDNWLAGEARKRRDAGKLDVKALLAEFRPQIMESRRKRNYPDSYSILEADPASLAMAEIIDLGQPADILLCTDGFYRAVDHYDLHTDETLLDACRAPGGVDAVLAQVRKTEATDPHCQRFIRFKPGDDATAVMLSM
jgi:hypothetical protein